MHHSSQKGRCTVDNIQEATSEPILRERMLEARLPSKSFEIADPRGGTQRFCRRCPGLIHAAQRFTEDGKIQNSALPFQSQAFLAWRHLHPKHILHIFCGLGFEGVIVNRERDEVIKEGE